MIRATHLQPNEPSSLWATADALLLSIFNPHFQVPELLFNELFLGYQVLPRSLKICDSFVNCCFAGFLDCLCNARLVSYGHSYGYPNAKSNWEILSSYLSCFLVGLDSGTVERSRNGNCRYSSGQDKSLCIPRNRHGRMLVYLYYIFFTLHGVTVVFNRIDYLLRFAEKQPELPLFTAFYNSNYYWL